MANKYGPEVGFFENQWNNPPPPLNPLYDPRAAGWREQVTRSMERDNYYSNHTREQCKTEWHRRYNEIKTQNL